MASVPIEINFPEQLKETRKRIQEHFKRFRYALRVRENTLLSRLSEIEKEYTNKTVEITDLLESLDNVKFISTNALKSNQLSDTQDAITTVINNKIAELTDGTYSRVEFEWDNLFENSIKQLGNIKLRISSQTVPKVSIFNINPQKMQTSQLKDSSQPLFQFASNNSGNPLLLNISDQQQQQQPSPLSFPAPVIPPPSVCNAKPTNPSTTMSNAFSPNQTSTFLFSATENTSHIHPPIAVSQQHYHPNVPSFNVRLTSSDVSKRLIKTAKRKLPHK